MRNFASSTYPTSKTQNNLERLASRLRPYVLAYICSSAAITILERSSQCVQQGFASHFQAVMSIFRGVYCVPLYAPLYARFARRSLIRFCGIAKNRPLSHVYARFRSMKFDIEKAHMHE